VVTEPVLTSDDRRKWDAWCRAALLRSRTQLHRRRVDRAREHLQRLAEVAQRPSFSWSAGKDSTAMTHLGVVGCGFRDWPILSVKDDLDFPGEEEYVQRLATAWGATNLHIRHPPFSLQEWVREHAISVGDDFHSKRAALSRDGFYAVIAAFDQEQQIDGVALGLRAHESDARAAHRATHGPLFRTKRGQWHCQPLCDWEGLDVYAYLLSHDVEILPLYRCCGFEADPSRIRKSWWVGGDSARFGSVGWLRLY